MPTAPRLGFTLGGPIIKDKFFFFGGYQFTDANTGLVPTARTRTRPAAGVERSWRRPLEGRDRRGVQSIQRLRRCKLSYCRRYQRRCFQHFESAESGDGRFLSASLISKFPRARTSSIRAGTGAFQFGNFASPGITSRTLQRNNPLVEVISVRAVDLPVSISSRRRFDGQLSRKNTLSGRSSSRISPGSIRSPTRTALPRRPRSQRDDRNRTLSIGDTHIFTPN